MKTHLIEGLITILIKTSTCIDKLNEIVGKIADKLIYLSERSGAEEGELKKESL